MSPRDVKSKNHDNSNKKETDNNERPEEHRKPRFIEGEERKMHEEIINRRITGGVKLSDKAISNAYRNALKQWKDLPGSVVSPPTDVISNQKRRKTKETLGAYEQTDNDTHMGAESE